MKSYNERLLEYEREKAKLRLMNLSEKDYEREIKRLAERLKI